MKKFLIVAALLILVASILAMLETSTVPRYVVNPGPLSQPHAFLASNCKACHTPTEGVEASSCIVCHANNESLLQREPTAFHGNIGSCKKCHTEHLGRVQRPITMNHDALFQIGLRQLVDSDDEVFGQSMGPSRYLNADQLSSSQSRLNCAACHAKEDPHNGQFGLSCTACHDTERWSIAAFRHPSPRSRDCAQCHYGPPCHQRHTSVTCAPRLPASRTQC